MSTRGSAWSDAEIMALISIWGESEIQEQLDGATRNKSIFATISRKLQESGYDRDWQQCRGKIKNLKADYKKVKDHNGGTGNSRKTCKFFQKLDAILGHRPASAPSVLLDAGSSTTATDEPLSQDTCIDAVGQTGNGKHEIRIIACYICTFIHSDNSDVQVLTSVDSALVPSKPIVVEPKEEDNG